MAQQTMVRDLLGTDAAAFHAIRMRSLKDHSEAFGSAYEDEDVLSLEQRKEYLEGTNVERCALGAFVEGKLIGIIVGYRDSLRKCKHRAHIGAMYVAPEARGHGAGRLLLAEALNRLSAIDGVEDIILAVTVGNDAARSLYASAGFESSYIDPRFFKIDGRYYDIEWMVKPVKG